MPDMEKVKKGLYQHCEGSMFDRCGECPYYKVADEPFQCRDALLMDALALLKEQEYKDKMFHALEEDWKLLKEQPEIVRCNDCKHYDEKGTCMKNGIASLTDRWFCADGERR